MAKPLTQPTDRAAPRLTYLIKRVEMVERARMEDVLRPFAVTLNQYTALSILERRGGLSSAQLARRHFVTPQAMNQLVALLERDGLVRRAPDPVNRKILRAWLTDHGEHTLAVCHRAVEALEEQMLAVLSVRQTEEFRRSLERILTALTELTI
jgi:DNA-binding MarR family transcriptional regulator